MMNTPWQRSHRHRARSVGWGMLLAIVGACGLLAVVLVALARRDARAQQTSIFMATPPSTASTFISPGATDDENPASLAAVVYNENDALSVDLAHFYAEKRGIPNERLVALNCSVEEEISREEYDSTIAEPLRKAFDERHWWMRTADVPLSAVDREHPQTSIVTANRIRYLVLIRGIPLKIRATKDYPGDIPPPENEAVRNRNEAAVDSELAVLGVFNRVISGVLANPYFRSYSRITEAGLPGLMLVGRLDAPSGGDVRRMIKDSLYAEVNGLWGRAYVDTRGLPASSEFAVGDTWMTQAAADLPRVLPTILDREPDTFPTHYPMTDAAVYYGWYTQNVNGPFARPDFHFRRGAIAYHLHSFSAVSLRDPGNNWTAPLISKGAAASLGCVYEPYLGLTPRVDVLNARLLDGFTFGESAYMASPALSWMTTVVGDPLYRPGRVWQRLTFGASVEDLPPPDSPVAAEGRAYLHGATLWRLHGQADGAADLEKSGRKMHSGLILEGLALLEAAAGDRTQARAAFEEAKQFYKDTADQTRVTIETARMLAAAGERSAALDLLGRALAGSTGDASDAIREMLGELGGVGPH